MGRRRRFMEVYSCQESPENRGNQITMPQSALDTLLPDLETDNKDPLLFQIKNLSINFDNDPSRISHCGVSEFTADEGTVRLPPSLTNSLHIHAGTPTYVQVKKAVLEKATYVKLQPHSTAFFDAFGPNLKQGLEESLIHSFFCITTGDTIEIRGGDDGEKRFLVNVVETKPGSAVSLVDTDCEVDFDTPLDYKEPEKVKVVAKEIDAERDRQVKFVPFSGSSRRLLSSSGDEPVAKKVRRVGGEGDTVSGADGDRQVKFVPFSGSSRRLTSSSGDEPEAKKVRRVGGEGEEIKVKSEISDGKKKVEPCKPFTGRKYTLLTD
ncbi:Ubiquitin recognition factor in ER-associated degradation protein 1 [Linum grandiflorum]